MEKRSRSLLKTLSWRIIATTTTTMLVFIITRDLAVSLSVGFLETIVKTIIYYLHERMWNMLNFGRDIPPSKLSLNNKDSKDDF